jgi:hypothetical protein
MALPQALRALLLLLGVCFFPAASDRNVPRALARYRELSRTVRQTIGDGVTSPSKLVLILDAAADAAALVKRHSEALGMRREAFSMRVKGGPDAGMTVADYVSGLAAIAQELQHEGRYKEALTVLSRAMNRTLDGASSGILHHFTAAVRDCMGQAVTALGSYVEGVRSRRGPAWEVPAVGSGAYASDMPPTELLTYLDLLRKAGRALQEGSNGEKPIAAARAAKASRNALAKLGIAPAALFGEVEAVTARMLTRGPWTRADQLPATYIPGLSARAWHSVQPGVEGSYPDLLPVVLALQGATAELAAEYESLLSQSLMQRETECIHTTGDKVRGTRGGWTWFATNGFWTEQDEDGCAADTPAACALLHRLAALRILGLRVLRAGYSAIEREGHLRPHCGNTNGQLKMHLGLVVPARGVAAKAAGNTIAGEAGAVEAGAVVPAWEGSAPSSASPCARMRVGNETRAWRKGGVLFFDDSFEHEVWNDCDATRVVFQLVLAHPDLGTPGEAAVDAQGRHALPDPGADAMMAGH